MRRTRWFACIAIVLMFGMVTMAFAGSEHGFDKKGYDKIAKKTIGAVVSGKVDVGKMKADMEKLVAIGIDGCKEHMAEVETPPEEKKIMKATIENAQKMKGLTLDQVEAQWHEGGYLKGQGVNMDKYDHFAEVMCHYDTIVHPATAIIALNEYMKTNNEDYLEQVKDELAEVIQHLKHLE